MATKTFQLTESDISMGCPALGYMKKTGADVDDWNQAYQKFVSRRGFTVVRFDHRNVAIEVVWNMADPAGDPAILALQPSDILSVYSGQDGKCCCGCKGKHFYNTIHRKNFVKTVGYQVEANEETDRQVRRILGIIQRGDDAVERDSNNISLVVGKRLYIAYFTEATAERLAVPQNA